MIETAGTILSREIRQAIETLYSSVTPVFDINDKREAELHGSAVLFRIGDDCFLATAKHVIDRNAHSSLYIDASSEMQLLEGTFFSSPDHDVAVLKLSPSQLRLFTKYTFLDEKQLSDVASLSRCKYANSIGYPASKNKKAYDRNALKRQIFSYSSMNISVADTRICIRFNKRKNIDALTGALVSAPDPYGMSGGAMFGVEMNDDTMRGRPRPMLIAILIEWDQAQNMILATPLSIVLAIIRDAYGLSLPERLAVPAITTHPGATP